MAITTTSVLPSPVQQTFDRRLLSVPTPNFIHKIPAMARTMPRNGGNTIRFRRYNPLQTAIVPVGNQGEDTPAQILTAIDIDAKISFYGTFVYINEQVTLQNQDPKKNGVIKSFLIDLETLKNLFLGNRAEVFCF